MQALIISAIQENSGKCEVKQAPNRLMRNEDSRSDLRMEVQCKSKE